MHHLRGKLREGDEVRLDPANIYIHFQSAKAGGQVMGWYGYLLVTSETDVEPGTYTLALEDGRSGTIRIDRLDPDDSGKYRAVFVGEGPLG
jgi:hypothetical protein